MSNKKGESMFDLVGKTIYWMLAGVAITMAILGFVMILFSYQSKVVTVPPKLVTELVVQRFLNAPECFTYQDPSTGRSFPGVIDVTKFTQSRMDNCYRTESKKGFKDYNFGVLLEGYGPVENGKKQTLMTNNYFNQVDFTIFKNVLVRVNNELVPSRMTIYVQKKI